MVKRWALLMASVCMGATPALARDMNATPPDAHFPLPSEGNGLFSSTVTQNFQWPALGLRQYGNHPIRFGRGHSWGCEGSGCNVPQVDPMTPTHLRLGGAQEYDSVPLAEHCYPYGGDWQGTCVGIGMGGQNMAGEAPGIGPGSAEQIAGYDHFDAAALTLRTVGATPIFTATAAGQDSTSPYDDGGDHAPLFSKEGATFSTPLPIAISRWLTQRGSGMRVITNELGCARSRCAFPNFVGIVSSYATDDTGRVSGFTIQGGWQIFEGGFHKHLVPGKDTVDGSGPALDREWASYNAPAVMFGGYTKSVGLYASVEGSAPTPNAPPGDVNNPTGGRNSQLRLSEFAEIDLWGRDPRNYRSGINGLLIDYRKPGGDGKALDYIPKMDSYNFDSEGATSIAYKMGGEYWTIPFTSPSFYANDFGGAENGAGSQAILAEFAQRTIRGYGFPGHWDRLTFWNTRNTPNGDYDAITTSLGVEIDGKTGGRNRDRKVDGVMQEHIELNPSSNHNGFAFCGYQQSDTSCNVVFDGSGNAIVRHTMAAQTLAASRQLVIPFGTPASSHAPCAPGEMKLDARYIYSCVAPNSWHRVSNGEKW